MKNLLIFFLIFTTCDCFGQAASSKDWYDLAALMHKGERYADAVRYYTKAIELDSDSASLYVDRGFSKCMLKDFRSAMTDFTTAILIDPKNCEAFLGLGLANGSLGDFSQGCYNLSRAGELGCGDAYAYIKKYCQQ